MTPLTIARNALEAILHVGRGSSGRLILDLSDEQMVREALAASKEAEMDMQAAFEAKYQRDWNDPAGNDMKAVWADAWAVATTVATTSDLEADDLISKCRTMNRVEALKHYRAQRGCSLVDARDALFPAEAALSTASDQNATWNALLDYVLDNGVTESITLLRLWREGRFSEIRREWPDAPEAIFPN